jgi:hypothetical protein
MWVVSLAPLIVSQQGVTLRWDASSGVALARISSDCLVPLPEHPNPAHMSTGEARITRPVVLSQLVAELLLEPLVLPDVVDRDTVYYGVGTRIGDDAGQNPFVHSVWFTPAAAVASGLYRTEDEFLADIVSLDSSMSMSASSPMRGVGAVQPAQGDYEELGVGSLPGIGRSPVIMGGRSHQRPFSRAPATTDAAEPTLSRVLTVATVVAHGVLPRCEVQAARSHMQVLESSVPALQHAYQYPHRLPGRPMLGIHQVALRRPAIRASQSAAEAETACQHAVSDLHKDRCDGLGGWSLGAGTLYWCVNRPREALPHVVSTHALRARDLAVFPPIPEPRGARVGVMRPGWLCVLFTRTFECAHGGVSPLDMGSCESLQLPGLVCGKAVTYPLRAVERLLESSMSECTVHGSVACARMLETEPDARLRSRMASALARRGVTNA